MITFHSGLVAQNSRDLQNIIDGKTEPAATVILENGIYDVHPSDKYRSYAWQSTSRVPYATRVQVHEEPLRVGHYGLLERVTFTPMGEFASLRLDHSSRMNLSKCIFRSRKQSGREGASGDDGEAWGDFEREGIGIETTDENIGDDAWGVEIDGCLFQALAVGIKVREPGESGYGQRPRKKGTINWNLSRNDFDGCEYGIQGVRLGEWKIYGGYAGLARVGIDLQGRNNIIRDMKFERNGEWDVFYQEGSCHNRIDWIISNEEKVNPLAQDETQNNRARILRGRAIWRPCFPPEE